MTDFVEASIRERAERAIRAHEVTVVAEAHSQDFADAIITPPQPNDRLRDAAAFFNAVIGER